jgi:hypothetical protein
LSEEKFSLNADPRSNYVNLILNDMKDFNLQAKLQTDFIITVRALRALLVDLPPSGQEYMKQELEETMLFEEDVNRIRDYTTAIKIYQKAISWVWPNMLQEYFQAKPRNPKPTTLGDEQ